MSNRLTAGIFILAFFCCCNAVKPIPVPPPKPPQPPPIVIPRDTVQIYYDSCMIYYNIFYNEKTNPYTRELAFWIAVRLNDSLDKYISKNY